MDNIAQRLKAYMEAHPFDPATATAKPSWTNSTTLIKNPMNPTHRIYEMVSGSWMICWDIYR